MSHTIAGTLLYLRLMTAKGWLASRLKRLKQPKYLAGAVVGVVYIYSVFIRNFVQNAGRRPPTAPEEAVSFVPGIAAAALLLLIAVNWIVPRGRAGLSFSEA